MPHSKTERGKGTRALTSFKELKEHFSLERELRYDPQMAFRTSSSFPQRWWRRIYVEEFYPAVHLGNAFLEHMLAQHGLKDKPPVRRASETWLPCMLKYVGDHVRDMPAPLLLWTLFSSAATVCLVNTLCSRSRSPQHSHSRPVKPTTDQMTKVEEEDKEERMEEEEKDAKGGDEYKRKEDDEEKKDAEVMSEENKENENDDADDDNDCDDDDGNGGQLTSEEEDHLRKRK